MNPHAPEPQSDTVVILRTNLTKLVALLEGTAMIGWFTPEEIFAALKAHLSAEKVQWGVTPEAAAGRILQMQEDALAVANEFASGLALAGGDTRASVQA